MTFNQFNKELNKRIADPNVRWALVSMFEMIQHQGKQLDDMASVVLNMADQMQRSVQFSGAVAQRVKRLERKGLPDGVDIQSVANDPEERKQ